MIGVIGNTSTIQLPNMLGYAFHANNIIHFIFQRINLFFYEQEYEFYTQNVTKNYRNI